MASILEVTNGTTTLLPGTTWAAPNGLFGTTADRNDGSAYGWSDSTATITLPSSGLADGYLFLWGFEFEDDSNGRHNPVARMIQASGTGTFVSANTGGYNRDASEDRAYVAGWSFVDGPSASSTYTFQWKRDTDTPTGGTVRSFIQAIPFYYADIGLYTSTSTTATGGTTPTQIGSFSGIDGTNITISSSQVSVTGDNKRYLCLGSAYHEGMGGSRTQRWFGFEIDGTFDDSAKGCMYFRNSANDIGGSSFIKLIETDTATRTVEVNQYRGDGVAAGQGGADVDGNTTSSVGAHAMVVIELNDSAEVFASTDATGGQEFALTGPVDVDIASTGDIEFSDAASFTRVSDTAVNCESAMDVFAFANVSHAREASSIGSGARWTVHGEFTINGTEDTDVGFHGNYNRGNQSSQDCHGSSTNMAGVFGVAANDDIGVSNQELAGTEGGGGDIETQANWVGFGLINLDTLEDSGSHSLLADDVESAAEVTAPVLRNVPRVWLNTTETKTGATEMTVTAWNTAGTSITFTDPSGAPTGSLKLGVENTTDGTIGWIDVTVNTAGADHDLLADDVESSSEVTSPSISQVHDLSANDVESSSEIGSPSISQVHDLNANGVEAASELTTPDSGQVHGLLADDVESTSEVTSPSAGQVHTLAANDTESSSEVDSPAITQAHAITADDTESASEVSSPTIAQAQSLSANDVESASEVSAPVLSESHTLLADDVESASELTTPSIGQAHGLSASDVESSSEIASPAITQAHSLAAGDVESVSELTTPDLSESHSLTADSVESSSELTSPSIGQVHTLAASDNESASEVSAPSIGQAHGLTADDTESSSEVSAPTLGQAHDLSASDTESTSEVGSPALAENTADHALLAEDIESATETQSSSLGQIHVLLAASIESASEISSPSLIESGASDFDVGASPFDELGSLQAQINRNIARSNQLIAAHISAIED